MQTYSERLALRCSLCDKEITEGKMDIQQFHLHTACADNMALMMRQINAFNQ
jgi:hypothetical protein